MAGSQDRLSLATMKLELTLQSASDMRDVDLLSVSKVYAVAWIEDGSRPAKQKTRAKEGYSNPRWNDADPKWNKVMTFIVEEEALLQDLLCLKLELRTKKTETHDGKKVGDVSIPIKFLTERKMNFGCAEFFSYRVRKPSGKFTGKINLTMRLLKLESKSNDIQPAAKTNAPKKGKKRKKKVPLTTRTLITPPTIESPCPPLEAVSPCSSPPYSPEGGPPCSDCPHPTLTPPDYLQQAAYPNPNLNPNPTLPPSPDYSPSFPPSPDYTPSNPCYPHQATSPYTTYSQAAAPLPPSPDYSPSFPLSPVYSPTNTCYPHQAASLYTTYSQAAAPLPPQVPYPAQYIACVGDYPQQQAWTPQVPYPAQYLAPVGEYPQQQALPLQVPYAAQYLARVVEHIARVGEYPPQQALKQKKKRKETKTEKAERKKKNREMKEIRKKMRKQQKKERLNHSTELALPYPHYPLQVQYPSSQHCPLSLGYPHPPFTQFTLPDYPHSPFTQFTPTDYPSSHHCPPSTDYPHTPFAQFTRPFYPQQAAHLYPNSTFPQSNYPQQAAYPNHNSNPNPTLPPPNHLQQAAYHNPNSNLNPTLPPPDYGQQAAYPNSNPAFPRADYPQQAAYPNPNFNPNPTFPPPDYPQQAAYPNPNTNPNPTFSPYAGHAAQCLAPGDQYPLQQAYPQQVGHTGGYSGCPYDQGDNIPYTVVPPAQQLAQRQRP